MPDMYTTARVVMLVNAPRGNSPQVIQHARGLEPHFRDQATKQKQTLHTQKLGKQDV